MNNYYPGYVYDSSTQIPFRSDGNTIYTQDYQGAYPQDERFFLGPFLVGGLAGTALGYGIANNNQMKGGCCPQAFFIPQPQPYQYQYQTPNQYPYMYNSTTSSNNFYY